jgi:hypothetical protein
LLPDANFLVPALYKRTIMWLCLYALVYLYYAETHPGPSKDVSVRVRVSLKGRVRVSLKVRVRVRVRVKLLGCVLQYG